jgi:hypothetical protein
MDYAVERDGATKVLLENGDRLTAKLVLGNITPDGNTPDGSRRYNVQTQIVLFVEAASSVRAHEPG